MQKLEDPYLLRSIAKELGHVLAAFSLVPTLAILMNPFEDIRSSLGLGREVFSVLPAESFLYRRTCIRRKEKIAVSSIIKWRLTVSGVSDWR